MSSNLKAYKHLIKKVKKLPERQSPFKVHSQLLLKDQAVYNIQWQNYWHNLHLQYKSFVIYLVVKNYLKKKGVYLNHLYLRKYHSGIKLKIQSLKLFKPLISLPIKQFNKVYVKTKKQKLINLKESTDFKILTRSEKKKNLKKGCFILFFNVESSQVKKSYKKLFILKQQQKNLKNLASFILNFSQSSSLSLSLEQRYAKKTDIYKPALKIFKRYSKQRFFWESLQLIRLLFDGSLSASLLGSFVYTYIRRNPKRIAFLSYIHLILNWHSGREKASLIRGVRIEVKGRFNAKSRAKKHIISLGSIGIQEKISNVDFAYCTAFTIFGSLGIKVWICPV